jgi:hypothetical protein
MTTMRVLRSGLVAAGLALLDPMSAAAQTQRQPANQLGRYDGVDVPGSRARVLLDTLVVWEQVPGSPGEVYAKARLVLDVLKIPYTRADSVGGLIFNEGFAARGGRLAGRPTSTSLRCGFGPTGDYADSWRVTVRYAVFIQPSDSANTRLGIAVLGEAKDIAGTGSAAMPCVSTGKLEYDIAKLVRN